MRSNVRIALWDLAAQTGCSRPGIFAWTYEAFAFGGAGLWIADRAMWFPCVREQGQRTLVFVKFNSSLRGVAFNGQGHGRPEQ